MVGCDVWGNRKKRKRFLFNVMKIMKNTHENINRKVTFWILNIFRWPIEICFVWLELIFSLTEYYEQWPFIYPMRWIHLVIEKKICKYQRMSIIKIKNQNGWISINNFFFNLFLWTDECADCLLLQIFYRKRTNSFSSDSNNDFIVLILEKSPNC